jgi:hypothetical protein
MYGGPQKSMVDLGDSQHSQFEFIYPHTIVLYNCCFTVEVLGMFTMSRRCKEYLMKLSWGHLFNSPHACILQITTVPTCGLKQAFNQIDLAILCRWLYLFSLCKYTNRGCNQVLSTKYMSKETRQIQTNWVELNLCSRINTRCSDVGVLRR